MARLSVSENERKDALEKARTDKAEKQYRYFNRHASRAGHMSAAHSEEENEAKQPAIDLGRDYPLFIALFFAILKDLSDFVGIGSLPLIGSLVTLLVSIIIGFMMFLVGAGEKKRIANRAARRIGTLIFGGVIEAFFTGVNFLPIETITVIIIMVMMANDRKGIIKIPAGKRISKSA